MPTDRQIAANRANARKSTGPRTPAGKAASSANSLKTGIYAKSTLLPGDDPAEYQALRDQHYATFDPANPDERDLLDLIVKYKWQLRRVHDCYDQMWLREVEEDLASDYHSDSAPLVRPFNLANARNNSLVNLSRMVHALDRTLHRTRTALLRAQDQRRRLESRASAPEPAAPAPAELASFPPKMLCIVADPAPAPDPGPAPRPPASTSPSPVSPPPTILPEAHVRGRDPRPPSNHANSPSHPARRYNQGIRCELRAPRGSLSADGLL